MNYFFRFQAKAILLLLLGIFGGACIFAQPTYFQTIFQREPGSVGIHSLAATRLPNGEFICVQQADVNAFKLVRLDTNGVTNGAWLGGSDGNLILHVADVEILQEDTLLVTGQLKYGTWPDELFFLAKIIMPSPGAFVNLYLMPINVYAYATGPRIDVEDGKAAIQFPQYDESVVGMIDMDPDYEWLVSFRDTSGSAKMPCTDVELRGDTVFYASKIDTISSFGSFGSDGTYLGGHGWLAPGYTRIWGVETLADGNLLLAGFNEIDSMIPILAKVKPDGTVLWSKAYPFTPGSTDFWIQGFVDAVELPDGRIACLATDYPYSNDTWYNSLVLVDSIGNVLEAFQIGDSPNSAYMSAFKPYPDGILMSGIQVHPPTYEVEHVVTFCDYDFNALCITTPTTLGVRDRDFGVHFLLDSAAVDLQIEYGSDAFYAGGVPSTTYTSPEQCALITQNDLQSQTEDAPSVWPNPVQGQVLQIAWPSNTIFTWEVTTALGKTALSGQATGMATLHIDDLPPALYLVRMMDQHGKEHIAKVIVLRK